MTEFSQDQIIADSNDSEFLREEVEIIQKSFNGWKNCLIAVSILFALYICALAGGIIAQSRPLLVAGVILLIAILVITIVVLVNWCTMLYHFWKLVPPSEAETTPGKAVGFIFIPIFNIYWFFIAIWKLSKHYEKYDPKNSIASLGLAYAILIPTLTILSRIPYISSIGQIVLFVLYIVWTVRMKNIAVSMLDRIE